MKKILSKFIGIRRKLVFYFLLSIMILGTTSLISYFTAIFIKNNTEVIIMDYTYLNTLNANVSQLNKELEKYLISASSEDLLNYYSHYNTLNHIAAKIPRVLSYDSDAMIHKDIGFMIEALLEETEKAVISKRGRNSSEYTKHFSRSNEISGYIDDYMMDMLNNRLSVGSVKYETLSQTMQGLFIANLILIVFVVIANTVMAIRSTYKLTHPISVLSQSAEAIARGNYDIELEQTHTGDETDILAGAFIKMAESIRGHIDELVTQAEIEAKLKEQEMQNLIMKALLHESELKVLQSQINPHFLFNTLNAAAQLASIEDAEKTSGFIQNIADVFRYNLKNMNELVTLKEEIAFVENYMNILKMRFGDRILFESEVDPRALSLKIPRITIQPIIENAYIHGLQNLERQGVIRIEVYFESSELRILVMDNGLGMTETQVNHLLYDEALENPLKHLSGIGLSNVIKRLKLLFRVEETSKLIDIQSQIDNGTKVTLKLPVNTNLE